MIWHSSKLTRFSPTRLSSSHNGEAENSLCQDEMSWDVEKIFSVKFRWGLQSIQNDIVALHREFQPVFHPLPFFKLVKLTMVWGKKCEKSEPKSTHKFLAANFYVMFIACCYHCLYQPERECYLKSDGWNLSGRSSSSTETYIYEKKEGNRGQRSELEAAVAEKDGKHIRA